MNQRNVEALIRVYREVMDELGLRGATAITVGDTAEALASRGVLGPASEVLTTDDVTEVLTRVEVGSDGEVWETLHGEMGPALERIAKGEA